MSKAILTVELVAATEGTDPGQQEEAERGAELKLRQFAQELVAMYGLTPVPSGSNIAVGKAKLTPFDGPVEDFSG